MDIDYLSEYFQIYSALNTSNIVPSHVKGLEKSFSDMDDVFFSLQTQHQQLQYLKRNLNFIVSILE